MLAGLLAFFWGLSAVIRQSFFTSLPNYAYRWNIHSWGWLLFALGIALFAAGATYLLGIKAGKWAAVGLAVLTAVAAFLFLPYSPVFGVIVVALCALAIWGCLRDDHVGAAAGARDAEYGYGSDYGYGSEYGEREYGERSMGSGSMGSAEHMGSQGQMGTEGTAGTRGAQTMGSRDTRT